MSDNNVSFGIDRRMFLPISDLLNEDYEFNQVISSFLVVSGAVGKPHLPGLGFKPVGYCLTNDIHGFHSAEF